MFWNLTNLGIAVRIQGFDWAVDRIDWLYDEKVKVTTVENQNMEVQLTS